MASSGDETRLRLRRAAEQLFARDGTDRVKIRDINALAGQRNESALHYHFGSKEGLLQTILVSHWEAISSEAQTLYDSLEMEGRANSPRDLIEVITVPLARRLESPEGRDFLQILPQMADLFASREATDRRDFASDFARPVISTVLAKVYATMTHVPDPVRLERISVLADAMTFACARRARDLTQGTPVHLDHDEFVENLVAMATASVLAPWHHDEQTPPSQRPRSRQNEFSPLLAPESA